LPVSGRSGPVSQGPVVSQVVWLKDHRQSHHQRINCDSTNGGSLGGSNEKAISRKRSAGRVGLGGAGGIRCRKAGAGTGICATAAGSGLHLERLLRRCKRGLFGPRQDTGPGCALHPDRRRVGRPRTGTVRGPGGGVIAPVPVGSSIAGDLNLSGFIGGFQGGCNYQWGTWVIGFEGDGMATNKEG